MKSLVLILSIATLMFIGCSKKDGSQNTTNPYYSYGYTSPYGNGYYPYTRGYMPPNWPGSTVPTYNPNTGCNGGYGTGYNYFVPVQVNNGNFQCWNAQYINSWNNYYYSNYGWRFTPYYHGTYGYPYYRVGQGDACSAGSYVGSALGWGALGSLVAYVDDQSPGKGFAIGAALGAGTKALYCFLDGKKSKKHKHKHKDDDNDSDDDDGTSSEDDRPWRSSQD